MLLTIAFTLTACNNQSVKPSEQTAIINSTTESTSSPTVKDITQDKSKTVIVQHSVMASLYDTFEDWKGTPYKLGGVNRRGIDCSAFVQNTFADKFSIPLPRTTRAQVTSGKKVDKNQLQAGDLVFFKTGYYDRHVGIYLQNNQFMHASTSKGVIISDLNNVYWRKHYWTAIRPGHLTRNIQVAKAEATPAIPSPKSH